MQVGIHNYTLRETGSSLIFSSQYRISRFRIFRGLASIVMVGMIIFLMSWLNSLSGSHETTFPIYIFILLLILLLIELFWHLCGMEIVEVNGEQITLKHQIFGVGISKNLSAQGIEDVFVSNQGNGWTADYRPRDLKFL